jgi:hypothetical protein
MPFSALFRPSANPKPVKKEESGLQPLSHYQLLKFSGV